MTSPVKAQSRDTPGTGARGDDDLMLAYCAGDATAFPMLYARHKSAVFSFLLRQLPDAQAHDAFQETWSKLIAAAPGYQARGMFKSYLFRIAHNALMDQHRSNMRMREADADVEHLLADNADPATGFDQDQLQRLLYAEVAKLPIAQRSVWVMKQESQLGIAEIAELTGATAEAVKSRLRYANEKLVAGMQRYVRR